MIVAARGKCQVCTALVKEMPAECCRRHFDSRSSH